MAFSDRHFAEVTQLWSGRMADASIRQEKKTATFVFVIIIQVNNNYIHILKTSS
jgi:hypothetical protein